jgi:hypothetical protein
MPKNRKLTYSDQQSQASHDQKLKKIQELLRKNSPQTEAAAAAPPKPAKKAAKKKKTAADL